MWSRLALQSLPPPCCASVPVRIAQGTRLRRASTLVCPATMKGPGSEKLAEWDCSSAGACTRDTPRVPEEEIPELLKAIPSWHLSADGIKITKAFTAKNFMAAIKFFNKLAEVAESTGHHPDLRLTNYRDVAVDMTTHVVGGLTMLDFAMAAKIDAIDVDFSPKWLKQAQEKMATAAAATAKAENV